ncbi:MAG TPA: hypothetical protein VKP13_13450, partial [Nitrospira sp.]|nr:hypothetical protein [Nitrospira sp.]
MRTYTRQALGILACLLAGAAAFDGPTATSANAASPLYYCPDRKADQQYSATEGPGCVPLVEKKEPVADERIGEKPHRDFKMENLQNDVSAFLGKYRQFLDCCKTDLSELRQVEELGEEVGDLLAFAQANLPNYSLASRGIMLREMLTRVAKARADLKKLRARLEIINNSSQRLDSLGYEEAGREARTIQELEESIERDIRAPKSPGSAKSGVDIGVAPAAGPGIGRSPKTGAEIGREGRTGPEIGASSKSSHDIGGSGPTGFGIGATGRAGPSIGESTLNSESSSAVDSSLQRSTVNSSISDSTVGSSLGSSAVGSSLQDSSVGSS